MVNIKNINKKFLRFSSLLLIISLLIGVLPIVPAQAAFPGKNGKIAFKSERDGNAEIYTMNPDGSAQTRLTNNTVFDGNPNWSPDGKKIAFDSFRDSGNREIYVMNADGTNQTRLTNTAGSESRAVWSPDGTRITFDSTRDGNAEIYWMNADGTGQTRLTNNATADNYPNWSPEGTKIVFNSSRDGNQEVYVMNADGSAQTRLTNSAGVDTWPDWSPDGTKITFFTGRDVGGNYEIYTINSNGTNPTRLTNNPAVDWWGPSFSPDGTKITWESKRSGTFEVFVMNADGSNPVMLTSHNTAFSTPSWQPLIGTTITDPADPNRIITTIAANESYPILDYTVDPNQTLILDGQLCDVTVASGGVLMGTGTACTITVNPGGTIAPGRSPGCLSSGNLSLAGTYTAELGGTTACTQYDQLQVTGTVTVGGNLSVSLINGFLPAAGNVFTLITNDGTDPVTGTFAGLAEGSTITIGGTVFKISYLGGTGNDVTLTALAAGAAGAGVTAPDTGINGTSLLPSILLLISGASLIGLVRLRAIRKTI